MKSAFLTIKQAAKLTGKSEVTIRRLIKRLLKNRTAQTDQMINLTNRHGSSVYKIERRFLIEHVNLPDDRKQELLSATSQSPTQKSNQMAGDQALNTQTQNAATQTPSGLDSTSEQADYSNVDSPIQMNNQPDSHTDQTLGQPIQSSPSKDTAANETDTHPDQSPTQTTGHFSEDGFQLLKTTLDHLTTQLDKKDDQIAAKDTQLSKLDKQLSIERERNEKLTQIIEQGNLLVHSAQQRIPVPSETPKGELVESTIDTDEVVDATTIEPTDDDDTEPADTLEKWGVISRLFSRLGRSDS